ncbi:MAG: methionyl-tRNA formyltransferase [Actinomycetota bacterium]
MRTVYIGTSEFAAVVLGRLAQSEHRPGLVVTRPERPRGRGRQISPTPVADLANDLGIALIAPESINDQEVFDQIQDFAPQALVLCAYGAVVAEPLLSTWPTFNVHPSLLPRWRGAAPIERAIMAGDQVTGVSIMRLAAELDAGPVCLVAEQAITVEDTYGSLAQSLATLGAELLVRALDEQPSFVEQADLQATYAEKITAVDRTLDTSSSAHHAQRVVRALTPHIGGRVPLADGSMLGVVCADLIVEDGGQERSYPLAGELKEDSGRLLLGCTPGVLELRVVVPAGGRAMSGADFLRGHGLPTP